AVVEAAFELGAVVDLAALEAEGLAELLVRVLDVPVELDVADVILRPLLDLNVHDHLRLLPARVEPDGVPEDAGAVVAAVVVERDEVGLVLLELRLLERLGGPEAPPPPLGGVLEAALEGALGEGLVPLEVHVADGDPAPARDGEREAGAAVAERAAFGLDGDEAIAFLGEIAPDDLLGALEVGGPEGAAAEERDALGELVAVAAPDPLEGDLADAVGLLDADGEEDAGPDVAVGDDVDVGEVAEPVEAADGVGEGLVPGDDDLLADGEPARLEHELPGGLVRDALDGDAEDLVGGGLLDRALGERLSADLRSRRNREHAESEGEEERSYEDRRGH